MSKQKKDKPGKPVDPVAAALAAMDDWTDDQRQKFLAAQKASDLTAATKNKADAAKAEEDRQNEAIKKKIGQIAKILDELGITKSVLFTRTEEDGWLHKIPKTRTGNGGTRAARTNGRAVTVDALDKTTKDLINSYLDPDSPKVPTHEDIRGNGTIGTFVFANGDGKNVKVGSSALIEYLYEAKHASTGSEFTDLGWGFAAPQVGSALNRYKDRKGLLNRRS